MTLRKSRSNYTQPGDDVAFLDLIGPVRANSRGIKYIVVIVDNLKPRRCVVKPVRTRTEAFKALEMFCKLRKPKVVQTDGDKALVFGDFAKKCIELGIEHRGTTPYLHYENGVVERWNRSIAQVTRALL